MKNRQILAYSLTVLLIFSGRVMAITNCSILCQSNGGAAQGGCNSSISSPNECYNIWANNGKKLIVNSPYGFQCVADSDTSIRDCMIQDHAEHFYCLCGDGSLLLDPTI